MYMTNLRKVGGSVMLAVPPALLRAVPAQGCSRRFLRSGLAVDGGAAGGAEAFRPGRAIRSKNCSHASDFSCSTHAGKSANGSMPRRLVQGSAVIARSPVWIASRHNRLVSTQSFPHSPAATQCKLIAVFSGDRLRGSSRRPRLAPIRFVASARPADCQWCRRSPLVALLHGGSVPRGGACRDAATTGLVPRYDQPRRSTSTDPRSCRKGGRRIEALPGRRC